MLESKEGQCAFTYIYVQVYKHKTANESGAGLSVVLASYVVLSYGTLEKVRGPFFTISCDSIII